MKIAAEIRVRESKEFQTVVADNKASQKLILAALETLKGFYGFLQEPTKYDAKPAGPPPPPGFKAYKKQEGSSGVIALMEQIIEDAKAMEADAIKAETDSQASYAQLVIDSHNLIVELETSITG